jgi:predicted metal-dependent phosphoesterase TrpH
VTRLPNFPDGTTSENSLGTPLARRDPVWQGVGCNVLKVDLHIHTSEDPIDNIGHDAATLIDRAAALDFDALAITLHDRQLAARSLAEYAADRGIVLLRGIERTIQGRHVVLVNFPQSAEAICSFGELAALKARCNGLVIAPHPFFPGGTCLGSRLDRLADVFDAVEWSYCWTRAVNFNSHAAEWARSHGKPIVGNSDLHDLRQLGRTHSWVAAEPDPDAICDAIRAGRVTLETRPVPVLELAQVLSGMFLRGQKRRPAPADVVDLATT